MGTTKLSRLRTLGRTVPPAPEPEPVPAPLLRRTAESVQFLPPWVLQRALLPFDRGGPGVGFGAATGTVSDRRAGRDVPRFWSELDLRGYRILARHITDTNPFGKGFLKLLVNYHVRKGYGWQCCKRGVKKTPYQTSGAPTDPLVAKGQRILDEFRDRSRWPLLSREAFRRWCRDGELIGRFFSAGPGRLPTFRFGEPDALGSPTGDTDGGDSFGIRTPDDDPAGEPEAFHFWNDDGTTGEWVDAEGVIYTKRNTDTGVKRGLPDFFPVASELDECTTLVRSMLATAIRQAKTAWIEKFPGRTAQQVIAAVPEYAPQTGYSGQARSPYDLAALNGLLPMLPGGANPWEPPGVVRKVEGDREYEPGPTSSGVPNYIQVEQAALRGCGVIWSFPEFFSGDASNANYASTLVAGTPFVAEVESNQYEFGAVWERPCALKVLELARDAGLLSWEEWRQLDVETTEPAVVSPQPKEDTQMYTAQLQAGVVSLDTVRQKLGYDPQHEAAGVLKDRQAQQQPQGPPGGGAGGGLGAVLPDQPPDAGGAGLGESLVREGFTGTITDTMGRERHYQDGKQVAVAPAGGERVQGGGDDDPKQAAFDELVFHDGASDFAAAVPHDDYMDFFGGATDRPEEAADAFAADFKSQLNQLDDYAAKAIEYGGGGEARAGDYAEARADIVAGAEGYKDALTEMADAAVELRPHQDDLSALAVSALEVEDVGRPPKRPDDPARQEKWAAARAEWDRKRAAAVARAKAVRAEEVAAVRAKMAEPMSRFKNARKAAAAAHRDMARAARKAQDMLAKLHAESRGPAAGYVSEADRSHLVPKQIIDRRNRKRTVYVVPDDLRDQRAADRKAKSDAYKAANQGLTPKEVLQKRKADAEPAREEARAAWQAALENPATVGAKEAPALAAHLASLTRAEIREMARSLNEKVGGLKKELVERMLKKVGVPTEQERRDTLEQRIAELGLSGEEADRMRVAAGLEPKGVPADEPKAAEPAPLPAEEPKRAKAAPSGPAAVWDAFQKATGDAKDYLGTALHNGGAANPEGLTKLPKGLDADRMFASVASAMQQAHRGGKPDAAAAVAAVARALGGEVYGTPGEVVPFDGSRHRVVGDAPDGVFTGTRVRVKVPGVRHPRNSELGREAEVEVIR